MSFGTRDLRIPLRCAAAVLAATGMVACSSSGSPSGGGSTAPAGGSTASTPSTAPSGGGSTPVASTPVGSVTASSSSEDNGGGDDEGGSSVEVEDFTFKPATLTVKTGTKVTWTFKDSADHTVSDEMAKIMSQPLNSGKTFSYTFSKAGTYDYICSIHQYMHGTVVVK